MSVLSAKPSSVERKKNVSKSVAASSPSPDSPNSKPPMAKSDSNKSLDSARRFTYYLLFGALLIWLYTLWVDRVTPMTDHVRVNAMLVRISPQISAQIEKVMITDNERVKRGQSLLELEQSLQQLEVDAAKLELQQASQSVDADTTAISIAKANEVAAQAKLKNTRQHTRRSETLASQGVISQSALEDSRAEFRVAEAQLTNAHAALEQAKKALGPVGENNPNLKLALNRLDQALVNFSYTTLYAPGNGVITNMERATGDYAAAGKPLLTFIDSGAMWLTAMVREISLANLKVGTPVAIILDSYPGRILKGRILSVGWGSAGNGGLTVDSSSGLMISPSGSQHAQRFPVNIRFDELPDDIHLRYGGRATVSFYPGKSLIGERFLDLWTWIWSYLRYVS